jgi:hypothetical protein
MERTKKMLIKAHLMDDGKALYYDYYHKQSSTDYFYKMLHNLSDTINHEYFSYNGKSVKYYDIDGNICFAADCIGKDVIFELMLLKKEDRVIVRVFKVKVMRNQQ